MARWTPNYAPDASASSLVQDWIEATQSHRLDRGSVPDLRLFLQRKRSELDLDLIDLIELRQYAHYCAGRTANEVGRGELLRSFETGVGSLIMDFGCAISG